tara:strand:- start:127 stop:630 length:504 start_codon:yes stop_codon:yes gene_type:complete
MKPLSLNQRILVQSSNYYGGQLIELHKTSVYDVIDGRVKMKKNHSWGGCPTRERSQTISTEEEAENFFNARFTRLKESGDLDEEAVYLVKDDTSRNSVSVFAYKKQKSVSSLREGTKEVYAHINSNGSSCFYTQEQFEFPQGSTQHIFCDTLEEALIEFKTKIMNNL